mgnify:CR=1 FL=1
MKHTIHWKNNGHALFVNDVLYKNVNTTKLDFYDFKKDYFSVCVLCKEVSASDIHLLCSAAVAATVSE